MLTEEQLIKIIIGAIVFVVVVFGVYLVFRNNIIDFFKNIGGSANTPGQAVMFLIK